MEMDRKPVTNRRQQMDQETNRMAGRERGEEEDDRRCGGVMESPYTWDNSMGKNNQAKKQMENTEGGLHTAVGEIACKARQGKTYRWTLNDNLK